MSEEQLKAFLEKVKADTSLQEKLNAAAADADAAIEIAKEAGFAITAEDIQSMQSSTVELSDFELEEAAGNGNPCNGMLNVLQFLALQDPLTNWQAPVGSYP